MNKRYKAHIVPTKMSSIGLATQPLGEKKQCIIADSNKAFVEKGRIQPVDIIITDPEAKIVVGNIVTNGYQVFESESMMIEADQEKVVASTNPHHLLPQLTPQDVQYIIDSGVEEVELEMEEIRGEKETESISYGETTIPLDVTPGFYTPLITNNCIQIVRKKRDRKSIIEIALPPQQVETIVEPKVYMESDMKRAWSEGRVNRVREFNEWLEKYNQSK